MNPFTQKTISSADAKITNASWRTYARNNATLMQKRQEDEENRKRAEEELAKLQAVKAGGKVNPDGTVTPKKAGFIDMAALGMAEIGGNIGDASRGWIDGLLGEEGNDKFDSAKDVPRFIGNLVPGMVEGLLSAGKNYNEAIGGERFEKNDKGEWLKTEDLSGKQRTAAATVGVLDTFGLAVGGSGKFLKEAFKKPIDNALKSTAKGVAKEEAIDVGIREVGKTVTRSATEGVEEAVQSVASDIQDDDELSEDWVSNALQSYALGMAAGGVFDVSGRAIGRAKNAAKTASVDKSTNTSAELRSSMADKMNLANEAGLTDAQRKTYKEALTKEAQRANAISDKDVRAKEFESRTGSLLDEIKNTESNTNAETEASGPAVDSITPEQAKRLVRIDTQFNQRLVAIEEKISQVQSGEDPDIKRVVANDGTDVTSVAKKFDEDIRKIETQIRDLQQQADGENNVTEGATPPDGVDPSEYTGDVQGRTNAAEQIIKLREQADQLRAQQAEQFEMLGGVRTTIDTKAARAKMQDLKRDKYQIQDWKIKNNLGETQASLKEKLDDIDRGVVSDEFVKIRKPAETVGEAVAMARETDSSDVSEIQRAAAINEIHREAANQKLKTLWTEERAREWEAQLDANYKAKEEQIKEMPGPKQEEEMAMLNDDYIEELQDTRARVVEDADDVLAVEQALKIAEDIDTRIVLRANDILASNPTAFGSVDSENMTEIRTSLEIAHTLRKTENAPESVSPMESEDAVKQSLRNAADVDEANTIIEEDPRLEQETATVVADQVAAGNLKGSLWDYGFTTMRGGLLKLENGEQIVDKLHGALMEAGKSDARMKMRAKNDKWKATYKTPEATEQSIAFWDQGEPLTKLDGESDSKFETRQNAANSVKEWLAEKAEEQGLTEGQMITNYFPHNFSQQFGNSFESVAEAITRLESNTNVNGNKLTAKQRQMYERKLQGIDLSTRQRIEQAKVYKVGKNGHLEQRQGAEGWSKDIPFVLEMYQRMSNKSTHIQPALDDIKGMVVNLEKDQLDFVNSVLDSATDKKAGLDRKLGDKGVKVASTARRFSNMALMGASVRTIALQPFAIINNWRDAPSSRQFIISTFHSMHALSPTNIAKTQPLVREFIEAGGMEGSFSTSLKGRGVNKLENSLLGGITLIDRTMRLGAYDMGKHDYAKKLGKRIDKLTPAELDAAKAAGVQKAREAQFGVGPLDIPLAQNNEVGKMIFQLQQFNIKQTGKEIGYIIGDKDGSLIKITKGSDGKIKSAHLTKKGAKNLLKTIAGYTAMYTLYTQMQIGEDEDSKNPFGFGVEDMLPFGEQVMWLVELPGKLASGEPTDTIQAPIPPLISAAIGRGGSDKGILGHLGRALAGTMGAEDIDPDEELAGAMKSAIRNFVPGGTQGVRTAEGAIALDAGESKNKSGSTRFLVDNDKGWNTMKGLIGGQYATTEGQEWLRKGMNTISKKNTVEMPDGSKLPVSEYVRNYIKDPEEKAAWIGYYATKQNADKQLSRRNMSRSDKLREIRLGMTSGALTEAQAAREAEKYNSTVRELYRPYYETIKNFPPRLANDYLEDVLINPQSARIPIQRRSMDEEKAATLNSWYEEETLDPASGMY